ncbi:hypothetical protein [Maribellus sediminis]|uniref:hypothetical protein n=1 Tax=Maribellus sediminis TaxID=2696285 RepID=UPI00142FE1BF|nr:hypothetical protein [Maribellus sediminis]
MVTSTNAELIYLSGPRNSYQQGPLGVIAVGAYADMLLVDGNPFENMMELANLASSI